MKLRLLRDCCWLLATIAMMPVTDSWRWAWRFVRPAWVTVCRGVKEAPDRLKLIPLWIVILVALTVPYQVAWQVVQFVAWAAGTVRYVDSIAGACAGNYSIANRNCTGSAGNSYATINAAIAAMTAGDITYIRVGTYTDANINPPAGVSASVPTRIEAYLSEIVTVRPGTGTEPRRVAYITGRPYITLWNIEFDGVNVLSDGIKLDTGSHNVIIGGDMTAGGAYRCQIHGAGNMGFSLQGTSDNVLISGCDIYENGLLVPSPFAHGLYIQKGTGFILEKSRVRRNGCNGIQLYSSSTPAVTNAILRRNQFYDNGRVTGCGTNVYLASDNHIFEYNEVWNDIEVGNGSGIRVELVSPSGTIVRHNTVYNGGTNCINVAAGSTDIVVQNNLLIGCTNGITNNGTNTTLTDNLTTGAAATLFTSITSGAIDLSLKSGVAPIDGGTNIGLAINGSLPDQGAREVPLFSSCEVLSGEPSKVRVRFTNNLRPPMLPASGVTGVTFRKNGASNAVVSSTRVGDNEYDFTITNNYSTGDPVDISIAPGSTNLADSSLIGNASNQPFVSTITNQSCMNSLSGAPMAVVSQTQFRFHLAYGPEAAPYRRPPGNTTIVPIGAHRLRIKLTATIADPSPTGFQLRVSHNGGAYAHVTNSYVNHVKMFAESSEYIPAGQLTTRLLPQEFATFLPGLVVSTSSAVPSIDFVQNSETELEYVIEYEATAVNGDTYDYRLYHNDGTPIGAYLVTPRVTIGNGEAAL